MRDLATKRVLPVLLSCCTLVGPAAAAVKRDIRGIGLGMTADQIIKSASVPCKVNKMQDVSCESPGDASEFKVMMSGGTPSVALSVKQTFCSAVPEGIVLSGILKSFGLPTSAARANPNGSSFDVTADVQGNLNGNAGRCKGGEKMYQLTIRDNSLMQMQSGPASAGQTDGLAKPPGQ